MKCFSTNLRLAELRMYAACRWYGIGINILGFYH